MTGGQNHNPQSNPLLSYPIQSSLIQLNPISIRSRFCTGQPWFSRRWVAARWWWWLWCRLVPCSCPHSQPLPALFLSRHVHGYAHLRLLMHLMHNRSVGQTPTRISQPPNRTTLLPARFGELVCSLVGWLSSPPLPLTFPPRLAAPADGRCYSIIGPLSLETRSDLIRPDPR